MKRPLVGKEEMKSVNRSNILPGKTRSSRNAEAKKEWAKKILASKAARKLEKQNTVALALNDESPNTFLFPNSNLYERGGRQHPLLYIEEIFRGSQRKQEGFLRNIKDDRLWWEFYRMWSRVKGQDVPTGFSLHDDEKAVFEMYLLVLAPKEVHKSELVKEYTELPDMESDMSEELAEKLKELGTKTNPPALTPTKRKKEEVLTGMLKKKKTGMTVDLTDEPPPMDDVPLPAEPSAEPSAPLILDVPPPPPAVELPQPSSHAEPLPETFTFSSPALPDPVPVKPKRRSRVSKKPRRPKGIFQSRPITMDTALAMTEDTPLPSPEAKPEAEPSAEPLAEPLVEPEVPMLIESPPPQAEPAEPPAQPSAVVQPDSPSPFTPEPESPPPAEPSAEPSAEPAESSPEPSADPPAEPAEPAEPAGTDVPPIDLTASPIQSPDPCADEKAKVEILRELATKTNTNLENFANYIRGELESVKKDMPPVHEKWKKKMHVNNEFRDAFTDIRGLLKLYNNSKELHAQEIADLKKQLADKERIIDEAKKELADKDKTIGEMKKARKDLAEKLGKKGAGPRRVGETSDSGPLIAALEEENKGLRAENQNLKADLLECNDTYAALLEAREEDFERIAAPLAKMYPLGEEKRKSSAYNRITSHIELVERDYGKVLELERKLEKSDAMAGGASNLLSEANQKLNQANEEILVTKTTLENAMGNNYDGKLSLKDNLAEYVAMQQRIIKGQQNTIDELQRVLGSGSDCEQRYQALTEILDRIKVVLAERTDGVYSTLPVDEILKRHLDNLAEMIDRMMKEDEETLALKEKFAQIGTPLRDPTLDALFEELRLAREKIHSLQKEKGPETPKENAEIGFIRGILRPAMGTSYDETKSVSILLPLHLEKLREELAECKKLVGDSDKDSPTLDTIKKTLRKKNPAAGGSVLEIFNAFVKKYDDQKTEIEGKDDLLKQCQEMQNRLDEEFEDWIFSQSATIDQLPLIRYEFNVTWEILKTWAINVHKEKQMDLPNTIQKTIMGAFTLLAQGGVAGPSEGASDLQRRVMELESELKKEKTASEKLKDDFKKQLEDIEKAHADDLEDMKSRCKETFVFGEKFDKNLRAQYAAELARLKGANRELEAELAVMRAKLSADPKLQAELDTYKQQYKDLSKAHKTLSEELQGKEEKIKELEDKAKLAKRAAEVVCDDKLREAKETYEATLNSLKAQHAKTVADIIATRNKDESQLHTEINKMVVELAGERAKVTTQEAELQLLRPQTKQIIDLTKERDDANAEIQRLKSQPVATPAATPVAGAGIPGINITVGGPAPVATPVATPTAPPVVPPVQPVAQPGLPAFPTMTPQGTLIPPPPPKPTWKTPPPVVTLPPALTPVQYWMNRFFPGWVHQPSPKVDAWWTAQGITADQLKDGLAMREVEVSEAQEKVDELTKKADELTKKVEELTGELAKCNKELIHGENEQLKKKIKELESLATKSAGDRELQLQYQLKDKDLELRDAERSKESLKNNMQKEVDHQKNLNINLQDQMREMSAKENSLLVDIGQLKGELQEAKRQLAEAKEREDFVNKEKDIQIESDKKYIEQLQDQIDHLKAQIPPSLSGTPVTPYSPGGPPQSPPSPGTPDSPYLPPLPPGHSSPGPSSPPPGPSSPSPSPPGHSSPPRPTPQPTRPKLNLDLPSYRTADGFGPLQTPWAQAKGATKWEDVIPRKYVTDDLNVAEFQTAIERMAEDLENCDNYMQYIDENEFWHLIDLFDKHEIKYDGMPGDLQRAIRKLDKLLDKPTLSMGEIAKKISRDGFLKLAFMGMCRQERVRFDENNMPYNKIQKLLGHMKKYYPKSLKKFLVKHHLLH